MTESDANAVAAWRYSDITRVGLSALKTGHVGPKTGLHTRHAVCTLIDRSREAAGTTPNRKRVVVDRKTVVPILAAALVLLTPGAVSASTPSTVTIRQDPSNSQVVTGKVKSAKASCKRNRVVKLYGQSGKLLVGKTTTGPRGGYRFTHVSFDGAGDMYTKVVKRGGCRAATSNKIFLGGT